MISKPDLAQAIIDRTKKIRQPRQALRKARRDILMPGLEAQVGVLMELIKAIKAVDDLAQQAQSGAEAAVGHVQEMQAEEETIELEENMIDTLVFNLWGVTLKSSGKVWARLLREVEIPIFEMELQDLAKNDLDRFSRLKSSFERVSSKVPPLKRDKRGISNDRHS